MTPESFHFRVDKRKLKKAESQDGHYLLRSNLVGEDPAVLGGVNFIAREPFLGFMREHGEVACKVAEELGNTQHALFAEMRSLGLARRTPEKLARLLLDLSANHHRGGQKFG